MKICKINDCEVKHYGNGYCQRHYMQIREQGRIVPNSKGDKNQYRVEGDIAYIVLRDRNRQVVAETIIDAEDLDLCLQHRWGIHMKKYVTTRVGDKLMFMHRLVMGVPDFKSFKHVIDHINRNTLDNRKENLRHATQRENTHNSEMSKANTSGTTGVYWDKNRNKWLAMIGVDGKNIHLGRFNEYNDAVEARQEAEGKYR